MKHPLHDILIAIAEGKSVQYFLNNQWIDLDPDTSFIINPKVSNTWRIKPKEKVKKYRWVLQDIRDKHILKVSDKLYESRVDFNVNNMNSMFIAVEPIESTMIEVEVDD